MHDTPKAHRLHETAKMPRLIDPSGSRSRQVYEIYAMDTCTISNDSRGDVRTGISMSFPGDCCAKIVPDHALAQQTGVAVTTVLLASDAANEIVLVAFNHSDDTVKIEKGQKIANLVLERFYEKPLEIIDVGPATFITRDDAAIRRVARETRQNHRVHICFRVLGSNIYAYGHIKALYTNYLY